MQRLSPACSDFRASLLFHASRSTPLVSSAPLPRGFAAPPATSTFSPPVLFPLSTQPAFFSLLTSMLSWTSGLSSPAVRERRASAFGQALTSTLSRTSSHLSLPIRQPQTSPAVIRTLTQRPQQEWATPNHALQRTAPRVTVAAIHVRSRPVRPWPCFTSVASFCAPPSQLPRRAPQSLSLRSLGVATLSLKP